MKSKHKDFIKEVCQKTWGKQPVSVKAQSSLSNYIYMLDFGEQKFILKIWNTDQDNELFVNKNKIDEYIENSKFFKELVYDQQDNYTIETFIQNKKINVGHIRRKGNQIRMQKFIAKYHNYFKINEKSDIQLVAIYKQRWVQIKKTIEKNFQNHDKKQEVLQKLDEIEHYIKSELLQKKFEEQTLCHNDLLLGNMLYQENTDNYYFIDYEYSYFNPPYSDVYNFLIESIYDYQTEKEEGYEKDMSVFPNDEEIYELLQFYRYYQKNPECNKQINDVKETEDFKNLNLNKKNELLKFYECGPLQNILWCLFGWLIFEKYGTQFDYVGFGFERFEQFQNDLKNIKRIESCINQLRLNIIIQIFKKQRNFCINIKFFEQNLLFKNQIFLKDQFKDYFKF